jgi:hypothetical protein
MACCAFALYLLTQLLQPLRWLRDRLFGAPAAIPSASVAWSPGAALVPAPVRRVRGKAVLLAIIAAELVGVGFAAAAPAAANNAALFTEFHESLCSSVFGSLQ